MTITPTGGIEFGPTNLPAATPTNLQPGASPSAPAPNPEPLPDWIAPPARSTVVTPSESAAPNDRIALANRMLTTARQMGDRDMEKRILADMQSHGFKVAVDHRTPALKEFDRQHAGFLGAKDASEYNLTEAFKALPSDMPPEARQGIRDGLGTALQVMGLPPGLGASIAEMGLRTGARVSQLDEAGQLAHSAEVRRQITAAGRDFEAVRVACKEAMEVVRAKDPALYERLMNANWIANASVMTLIAEAWGRAKERRSLALH